MLAIAAGAIELLRPSERPCSPEVLRQFSNGFEIGLLAYAHGDAEGGRQFVEELLVYAEVARMPGMSTSDRLWPVPGFSEGCRKLTSADRAVAPKVRIVAPHRIHTAGHEQPLVGA